MSAPYRVTPTPLPTASRYATAPQFATIVDAYEAMREGVVWDAEGNLAAFHERHAEWFEGAPDYMTRALW